jgi:hypothetical protein
MNAFRAAALVSGREFICLSVCLSIGMHQRGSHWTDISGILYWGILWKYVGKYESCLKIGQKYRALYLKIKEYFVSSGINPP